MECIYCLLLLFSFLVWSWGVCIWIIWLNPFWVLDQLHLNCFPITLMGLKCLFWSWWYHGVTCLTWPLWSLRSIILEILPVARWEPMDIVTYHLMFSIARGELMWLLWIILMILSSHLYMTEVILLWFFDLWFHELRVGNLYVVLGSVLQLGSGP